jgi:hypothetical protein
MCIFGAGHRGCDETLASEGQAICSDRRQRAASGACGRTRKTATIEARGISGLDPRAAARRPLRGALAAMLFGQLGRPANRAVTSRT